MKKILLLFVVCGVVVAQREGIKSAVKYPVQTNCMEKELPGDLKSVTCYGFLPESGSLSSQVVELNIQKANIKALQANIIRNLGLPQSLTTLRLTGCGITSIDSNVFESLPNLRVIDISQNKLLQIPAALFTFTPNVEEVILRNNTLQTLPRDCFSKNKKLVTLDLNNNMLTEIPLNLPKALTRLYLLNNNIVRLPLADLPNLSDLNLCGNGISFFPQDVVGYPKLQNLCLGTAELQQGSNGFQKLKESLKRLTLDGAGTRDANLPSDVITSISSCQQLEALSIQHYRLTSIQFISSLSTLQQLRLRNVNVHPNGMPKSSDFRGCPNLHTLDLTESNELAQTILYNVEIQQSLQSLKHLIVRDCGLTNLNWFPMPTGEVSNTAVRLPQLNTVDVSMNKLDCDEERTNQVLCYLNNMTSNFTRSTNTKTEPRIVTKPNQISFPDQMTVENTDQTICQSSSSPEGVKSIMAMDFANCYNNVSAPTTLRPINPVVPRSNDTLPTPEEQQGLSNMEIWYIVLGVLLFILVVLAIVLIVICCIRKQRRGTQPIPSSGRLEDGRGQPQTFQKLKEASSEDKLLSPKK